MSNSTKVFAALLGGAAIGAIAALLLAPKSGAELRADIIALAKEKGLDLNKEDLEAFCSKVIAKVRTQYDTLFGEATEAELEAAVNEVIEETKA